MMNIPKPAPRAVAVNLIAKAAPDRVILTPCARHAGVRENGLWLGPVRSVKLANGFQCGAHEIDKARMVGEPLHWRLSAQRFGCEARSLQRYQSLPQ